MKSEQIKEITEKATEHLVAALNAGRSEALASYLKAIGRFHHYSLTTSCSSLRKNRTPVTSLVFVRGTSWAAS